MASSPTRGRLRDEAFRRWARIPWMTRPPHTLFDLWFDTHPSIRFRAAFAEAYDPWAPGMRPKYFTR